jgi:23S rRNA (guanosine2251-2'-O)-methyltransferase
MKRIVVGPRAVHEAVVAHSGDISAVFVQEDAGRALNDLAAEAGRRGVKVEARTKEELDALAKGHKHQGVVAITGAYSYVDLDTVLARAASPALIVALDEITDPHNLGAIVRSAVAFGADGVITLKHRAAPVTPVVVRASAGATEHARIAKVTNLARTLEELAERGMSVVGLDAAGDCDLHTLPEAPEGRVIVVGAEGKGMRRLVRERCTVVAKIAHPGPVASLNASVAASIALYEAFRQRGAVTRS